MPSSSPASPSDTSGTGLPCILLVEDSATTKAMLSKYLGAQYRLLHAKDGEEAWELLLVRHDIELVLTDIQMPRLSGQQLLARIRKSDQPRVANLPVIVMTAADDNSDRHLAFINGANDFITKPFDEIELTARINVHQRLARTILDLEASRHLLSEQASTDSLTHLRNRRAFFESGAQLLSHAKRHKGDLSAIIADIDHFKRINDTHGHDVGDQVLVAVARIMAALCRGEDVVARLGGEEFALLLPDTNRLGAAVFAERLRAAIERERLIVGDTLVSVTISLGIASYGVDATGNINELLKVADRRLYLAKQSGRNRICVNDDGKTSFA